ncbi:MULTISPECIES: glycosyltransferase [unclassified Sphingomonas]|jgi:UDP:flavonoid glycosyltransferase YjiC (YdhE family)|uniref:glycosyltransferase n=1 Tax=unclassified Sphingomonas TaxID=196159 RepID=UPI0008338DB2|nr:MULTISPECIES: glycosyltransferase [unclassified Sphingomonas]
MSERRPIVLVTLGSIGDLLPFLAVGKALRKRGHAVIVATHDEYESACRMLGLGFCGIWDGQQSRNVFRHVATSSPTEIWARVRDEFFVPAMEPTFAAVERLIRAHNAVVVAAWSASGAGVACEATRAPFYSVYLSPHALVAEADAEFHFALDRFRRSKGIPSAGPQRERARLALFPGWFHPPERPWPADVQAIGFPFLDDALLPVSLSKLRPFLSGGSPPFVFTPGSFMSQADAFFAMAVDACEATGRRALFLTPHREQIPAALPPSIMHLDYLPLHRVLGACAGLFHHGGIGTCAQALRAGTMQILSPLFFDQFENARRIEQLGGGVVLDRGRLSAQTIIDMMDQATELAKSDATGEATRSQLFPNWEGALFQILEDSDDALRRSDGSTMQTFEPGIEVTEQIQ